MAKKKRKTEFQRLESLFAKLDHRMKKEKETTKIKEKK